MPVTYSPERAAAVGVRLAQGESVEHIARSPGMPSARTLFRWMARDSGLARQYAEATAKRVALRPRSPGRPTGYAPELAVAICERVMAGHTLRRICAAKGMPPVTTLLRWLKQYPDFTRQYSFAKDIQADVLADEILDIADDRTIDYHDRRISVEVRKWLAAVMRPKKYGERAAVELTGSVSTLSDEELDRQIRELLAKANGAYDDVIRTEP